MIRFLPDTWRDALLRPLAMAAPDGGVYVEIMAPDFRFLFILVLVAALAIFRWRSIGSLKAPAILLAATMSAFIPWLLTTGNGRYFLPFLLTAGPLCLAGVYLLPATRGFRLTLAVCLVAIQAFATYEASPLRSWGLGQWRTAPYFQIDVPRDMVIDPSTYVTISSISYSLIAPLFHPSSRWINLSNAPTDRSQTLGGRRTHTLLASGLPLTLFAPSIPGGATDKGLPNSETVRAINILLADHRLAILQPNKCRLLRARGLVSGAKKNSDGSELVALNAAGFWACPLKYPMADSINRGEIAKSRFDAIFEKVETICPRFFRPGEAATRVINGGELREYGGSDMKVYVLDDGAVMYKYYRSYTPQLIGKIDDVMSGKVVVDCGKIRGRSGLPWEHDI